MTTISDSRNRLLYALIGEAIDALLRLQQKTQAEAFPLECLEYHIEIVGRIRTLQIYGIEEKSNDVKRNEQ